MMCLRRIILVVFVCFCSLANAEKVVKLSSLDWPPYTGSELTDQGVSSAVVRAAFEAMDYKVEVVFYPWARAVDMAKEGKEGVMGYFPEYYSADIEKEFTYSNPIGSGPLGFAQNVAKPVNWTVLDDLAAMTIGVVRDYVNTEEFDIRVAQKKQNVQVVTSDSQNLQKVAAGRIPLAVIDKNVMNYLLQNDAALANIRTQVEFNPTLLEEKQLFVCFNQSAAGKQLAEDFAAGLKKIDISTIEARYSQK
jgi:polar amino acid transport system substrate-binding protein